MMVSFPDSRMETYGIEPICKCLPIAPSAYYEEKVRHRDLTRLQERKRFDLRLNEKILRIWNESCMVYGVRRVWLQG
jgi:putative transposase